MGSPYEGPLHNLTVTENLILEDGDWTVGCFSCDWSESGVRLISAGSASLNTLTLVGKGSDKTAAGPGLGSIAMTPHG